MTNLPAPYAFDMSDVELQDNLEEVLRNRRVVERKAFTSLAYLTEARLDFVRRVERAPKARIDKHGVLVADRLASAAYITPEGELHVMKSMTTMAQDAKIDFKTFDAWLTKLANHGLVEIIERGRGNGHPTHIQLCIREEHLARITEQARRHMTFHLNMHSQNQLILTSTST